MIYKYSIFSASLLIALLFMPQANSKDKITFLTGYDYSQGDYGAGVETIVKYIPFTIKFEKSRLIYKLTVPYITITGPGNLIGRDATAGGSGSNTITTESGLGDVIAAVSYNLLPYRVNRLLLDITAKIKIPTADENRGLGSGKFDFYFQADALRSIEKTTIFGSLGYKLYGDTSDINYKNTFYYSFGGIYPLDNKIGVGLIYDYRQASTINGFKRNELTTYINIRLDRKKKLLVYIVRGLSDGSPDWGLGISLSYLL